MSTELVEWAVRQTAVSHRARVVLVYMAELTRDRATGDIPARTYVGGWERLGLAVVDPDLAMTPESRHAVTGRLVGELVAGGCVKVVDNPGRGHTQWYQVGP